MYDKNTVQKKTNHTQDIEKKSLKVIQKVPQNGFQQRRRCSKKPLLSIHWSNTKNIGTNLYENGLISSQEIK